MTTPAEPLIYTTSVNPKPEMEESLIQAQAVKIQELYAVEPKRMEKAIALYHRGACTKFNHSQIWKVSSDKVPAGYRVDEEKLTCTCPDWTNHNSPDQESSFCCKHLAAVMLFNHIQAELARQQQSREGDSLDHIMEVLFGTPLNKADRVKAETAV
jgi:hypothetical protein